MIKCQNHRIINQTENLKFAHPPILILFDLINCLTILVKMSNPMHQHKYTKHVERVVFKTLNIVHLPFLKNLTEFKNGKKKDSQISLGNVLNCS